MANARLESAVRDHHKVVEAFFAANSEKLEKLAKDVAAALRHNNKLLLCGNGGSASDALHIAAEFVGRFVDNRVALPAISLTADSAALTAIGNDYGFDHVYARQVEALGWEGDILIAMSTSGNSANVLQAIGQAKGQGLKTVLLTGEKARGKENFVDYCFIVPTVITARIQEVHIMMLHLLVELVEEELF